MKPEDWCPMLLTRILVAVAFLSVSAHSYCQVYDYSGTLILGVTKGGTMTIAADSKTSATSLDSGGARLPGNDSLDSCKLIIVGSKMVFATAGIMATSQPETAEIRPRELMAQIYPAYSHRDPGFISAIAKDWVDGTSTFYRDILKDPKQSAELKATHGMLGQALFAGINRLGKLEGAVLEFYVNPDRATLIIGHSKMPISETSPNKFAIGEGSLAGKVDPHVKPQPAQSSNNKDIELFLDHWMAAAESANHNDTIGGPTDMVELSEPDGIKVIRMKPNCTPIQVSANRSRRPLKK